VVLEDLPPSDSDGFGVAGRIWVGNRQGLKPYPRSELDAETQSQLAKLLDGLRRESVASYNLRAAEAEAATSREKFERTKRLERALQKRSAGYAELIQGVVELADRLGPQPGDEAVTMSALLSSRPIDVELSATPVPAPSAGGDSQLGQRGR
jgi:hypothetical protein